MFQDGSLDPKSKISVNIPFIVYMLKSQVKFCDVTKRRMPISFMIRFVNASDSVQSGGTGSLSPQK